MPRAPDCFAHPGADIQKHLRQRIFRKARLVTVYFRQRLAALDGLYISIKKHVSSKKRDRLSEEELTIITVDQFNKYLGTVQ